MRTHILKNAPPHYTLLVALIFSLIPFFKPFGITVAGLPFLLLAFLNILKRKTNYWEWGYILLFPFYSSIVWGAPYINILLGLIWLIVVVRQRTLHFPFLLALIAMDVIYVMVNYQMVAFMFFSDIATHREEYQLLLDKDLSFFSQLFNSLYAFAAIHYHVGTLVTLPIFLLAILGLTTKIQHVKSETQPTIILQRQGVPCLYGEQGTANGKRKSDASFLDFDIWILDFTNTKMLLKVLLISVVGIALFSGFYFWFYQLIEHQENIVVKFIKSFNINRITILLPFLWMLILALALKLVQQSTFYRSTITAFLITQMVITVFANDEIVHNYRNLLATPRKPGFAAFVAKDLFGQIKQRIGKPQADYRVACLGINPTVAQYNGFYTLDALRAIYLLDYKKQFRQIIAPELAKDTIIQRYFDGWGNRCYLYSAELGREDAAFMQSKYQKNVLENWAIDVQAFQRMGGEYVISALPINHYEELGLQLVDVFEEEGAFWRIYLYGIKK